MSDPTLFVGVEVRGIDALQRKLDHLPPVVQDEITDAVSIYLMDVLRTYPPQKSIRRKTAYGVTFFTAKQRRWFFAALRSGELSIPYRRTGETRRGWKQIGKGASSILANETQGAYFSHDNDRQARLNKLVGWSTIAEVVDSRKDRILRVAYGALKRAMKKVGIK